MSDRDTIIQHVAAKDGPVDERCITHIVPPDANVSVSIHVIRPRTGRNYLTLFTTGVSDKAMPVPTGSEEYRYTELMINLPPDWKLRAGEFRNDDYHWPIAWLFKVGYYPHSYGTWLGGPFTIFADEDPPPPIAGNTALSCMLLVADKSDWGRVSCGNRKEVFFYSLMPLYTEERDLELRRGMIELIKRFHIHDIPDVVDLNRLNVGKLAANRPWWKIW